MRLAIYYAPEPLDPLWVAASAWLGRDAETGARRAQPGIPGIEALTESPRRYGFHATLKPPMRLATSYDQVLRDAGLLAARLPAFELPPLRVQDVGGFLALREAEPCPALHRLADACVEGLDRHRAPATPAELERRRRAGLSPEQEEMLGRWGYPHVFGTWFFHMTLTRRLDAAERDRVLPLAEAHFGPALAGPRRVDALCVFTQAGEQAPFLIAERLPLTGSSRS